MTASSVIAIVFDFDDTLAPDSTSAFLESLGLKVREFWEQAAQRVKAGWDPVPAYLEMMIEESRSRPPARRITRAKLSAWGRKIKLHPGLPDFFGRIRKQVKRLAPDIQVEFYVISSGVGDMLRSSPVAPKLADLWASDFSYNARGEIDGIKNVISFTDKTRFLSQISKGITGKVARQDPFLVNKRILPGELRVPFDQMIMVGDGYTDIPCFSLVQKNGGVAIGVYERHSRERWGKAWGFIEDQRVKHLVAADYRRNSGLSDALTLAVDKIAREMDLRSITFQR